MSGRFALLGSFALAAALAAADAAPMAWTRVHTNEIARWCAEHRAPDGVTVDKAARRVTFLAEATGISPADSLEFFAIGPLSDRAYESFAVSVASPAAIAAAADAAGFPRGLGVDATCSRLWPQGEGVQVTVRTPGGAAKPLAETLVDAQAADAGPVLGTPVLWTGGARAADGTPVAATNIPCAVFALYNHGASLLQLDGLFDQSSTYGRFKAALAMKPGDLLEISLTWDGVAKVAPRTVTVSATGDLARQLAELRTVAQTRSVYARLAFTPDVTLARAAKAATAFRLLDGKGVKMNGAAEGQFFYSAFLPEENWRTRKDRLFQPFEIHVSAEGARTFVFVEEDWSGPGDDPVLKPHETPFKDWNELPGLVARTGEQGGKVNVLFLYAPAATPVATLAPVITALGSRITTYYVFAE